MKVVDPSLFHRDIFATLSKADLKAYKKLAGEPVPTLWKILDSGTVLEMEASFETLPYGRVLWIQARLVEWKAEKQGWSKGRKGGPGYISVESFFSDDGEGEHIKKLAHNFENVSLATTSVTSLARTRGEKLQRMPVPEFED